MSNQGHTPDHSADADSVSRIIMLTYGKMQDGKGSFWCYVAVKPSEYDRFTKNTKGGSLNLQTFEEDGFGEVIVSGPGMYPPQEVTADIARIFNAPIKELFNNKDPKAVIAEKIAQLGQKSE